MYVATVLVACFIVSYASIIPADKAQKGRVFEKELSDVDHYDTNDIHNDLYDQEAFLGSKDEVRRFEDMTVDESKAALSQIYDKIDTDGDKAVTKKELHDWIKFVQDRYVREDTDRQWQDNEVVDGFLTWESYATRTFGDLANESEDDPEEIEYYQGLIKRDERRWKAADGNGDDVADKLDMQQFLQFAHPEDVPHMRKIVVSETIEDIDKDGDGLISLDEYISDMWSEEEDGDEPEWIKTEREQFETIRDKNKDGKMDEEEVADWILPPDYDHTDAEATHLLHQSDSNEDGVLTKDEVLEKYDIFVGSQATDFGEELVRHDPGEL